MIVDYKCKQCSRPGAVEVEDGPTAMFHVEKWLPILCCNRCADFLTDKRKLVDAIARSSVFLSQSRLTTNGQTLLQIEAKIREKLNDLTKRMSALVCNYYRKTNVWDVEFVNMLMDRPDMFWQIVHQYVKGIKTI